MDIKELVPNLEPINWIEQYLNYFGIKDTQEYLYPTFKYVESPEVYDNMHEAYELIKDTVAKSGIIGFVQDCDVDGILSTSILYQYLRDNVLLSFNDISSVLKVYFHSDKKHGITENVLNWTMEHDISLLIVPDAGSNDYTQQQDLNFLNVNIIILDHHIIEKNKSKIKYESNYKTVVISNQQGWVRNKSLSGTGVVAKFLKYIDMQEGLKCSAKYADLVALSLVSDMCDITSQENRSFLLYGLSKINNPFFTYLIENFIYQKDNDGNFLVNQHTLGFNICPYLNAVCRSNNQKLKKELFYAFCGLVYPVQQDDNVLYNLPIEYTDLEEYKPLIERLIAEKDYQDKVVNNTLKEGEICLVLNSTYVPVLGVMILTNPLAYPYTGLIANKLKRAHECNIFVIHEENGMYIGSCRADMNTLEICKKSNLFELAQGHEAAHGIILKKENLETIKNYFKERCTSQEKYKILVVKSFDFENETIFKSLFGFADEWNFLWNSNFVKPVFHIHSIRINSKDIQMIGNKNNVMKFKKSGIEFIKFKITENEKAELFLNEDEDKELILNVVCNLIKNEWKGRITLQAVIELMEINYEVEDKIEDTEAKNILTWEDVFG